MHLRIETHQHIAKLTHFCRVIANKSVIHIICNKFYVINLLSNSFNIIPVTIQQTLTDM